MKADSDEPIDADRPQIPEANRNNEPADADASRPENAPAPQEQEESEEVLYDFTSAGKSKFYYKHSSSRLYVKIENTALMTKFFCVCRQLVGVPPRRLQL